MLDKLHEKYPSEISEMCTAACWICRNNPAVMWKRVLFNGSLGEYCHSVSLSLIDPLSVALSFSHFISLLQCCNSHEYFILHRGFQLVCDYIYSFVSSFFQFLCLFLSSIPLSLPFFNSFVSSFLQFLCFFLSSIPLSLPFFNFFISFFFNSFVSSFFNISKALSFYC